MKIYLSKYWIAGHISLVCVEVAVVVATAAFCIEYRDEENILLIICSLVLIGITYYVQSRVIYLLDYVEVSNNQFTQCSFSGKRKRAVNSDEPIYYQIVPLFEGFFLRADPAACAARCCAALCTIRRRICWLPSRARSLAPASSAVCWPGRWLCS